jgi:hypothetical protein
VWQGGHYIRRESFARVDDSQNKKREPLLFLSGNMFEVRSTEFCLMKAIALFLNLWESRRGEVSGLYDVRPATHRVLFKSISPS